MSKFLSRKLLMALVGASLIIANRGLNLNLPENEIYSIAGVIITYLIGQSAIDLQTTKK